MKIYLRILSILLVVALPIVTICLGINVAARMPDVYQYQFKATEVLSDVNINKTDDEMGEFISHFMVGKTSQFQLWTDDDDKPDPIFSKEETAAAAKLRHQLNILAIIGFVFLIPMIIALVVFKKKEFDPEIRKYYNRGLLIYVILLVIGVIGNIFLSTTHFTIWQLTDYVLKKDSSDILPQLITDDLVRKIEMASVCVSAVFMGIVGYVINKLTAPKRIFSRN